MNVRIGGHSIYDAYTDYLTEAEIAGWESGDPIPLFEQRLRAAGHGDDSFFQETEARNLELIEEAVNYAKDSPFPEGHEASGGVFAP
jgi:pyruvate dehydrogenase E1 component alpha subunit